MMAMRWIHANGSREDVRELRDILSADMQVKIAAGAEMVDNTWSVTIPESAWNAAPVEIGHYLYSPGTEWGGPVTLVTHSTGDKTVTLQGPTWRGLLFRKLIYPAAGEDYYEITDADANAALATLIGSRFGSLMAVSSAVSGVEVSGRWRYATLAEAIDGMFRAYNLRLDIAYDDVNGYAVLLEPFGLRIYGSGAQTACDKDVTLFLKLLFGHFYKFGRLSQRAHYVGEAFALLVSNDVGGRCADFLGNDSHSALLAIEVTDGKWNAFALFVGADDEELSGLCRCGKPGSMNLHPADDGGQHLF